MVATGGRSTKAALAAIRRTPALRSLPILVDGRQGPAWTHSDLSVDAVARSIDELVRQVAASLTARRFAHRDELVRWRLEVLLELNRVDVSATPVDAVSQEMARRLGRMLDSEQVSLLLLEGTGPRRAFLLDGKERLPVELALFPSFSQALQTRLPVAIDGGWVVPLSSDGDSVAAFVVRRSQALETEELDFLEAVGVALRRLAEREEANAQGAKARQTLEVAYLDRYKELIDANNRLRALDRKKNELLAVLSHDLRVPLNVLIGHSHLLLTDSSLSEAQRASGEVMQRTSKKVLELVESILEKSRGEEGRIALFTRTIDVAEICKETVRDLQILARAKGVNLRVEAPLSLCVVGDEQKIRQVLQNLVTNALEHAKCATQIMVSAQLKPRPDGDVALIEVRDDGQVPEPNDLVMAFDRSRGLGLAICRDYVERHGGEIWAEAPLLGGAVFAFTLPIKEGARSPPPRQVDVPLVLVAEDDPVLLRVASLGLSGHYRIETARDGLEVLRKAKELQPDVIVMDAFMSQLDGLEALRELRTAEATKGIPVVLIAGNPEIYERLRELELGVVETLTKPFALSGLLSRVSVALQRSRSGGQLATGIGPGNDPETGLFDHFGILNRLQQEVSRSQRYGRKLTVAVLRPVAPIGDGLQRCVALVRKALRAPDVVGHLGAGVLVLLLPETQETASASLIARLCGQLEGLGMPYRASSAEVGGETTEMERLLEQLLT